MSKKQPKVYDYLEEFTEALKIQLEDDDKRWGNTWLERPRKGQEEHVWKRFEDYFAGYYYNKSSVPWLKVAGNALIAWIRENNPEMFDE